MNKYKENMRCVHDGYFNQGKDAGRNPEEVPGPGGRVFDYPL